MRVERAHMENILDYFPKGLEPRQVQIDILQEVEAAWQDSDVIVIRAAVAAGKSSVAKTIADWRLAQGEASNIVTPTKLLVDQYARDFEDLNVLKRADSYKCFRSTNLTCKQQELKRNLGHRCMGCHLNKAKREAAEGVSVCNTWVYQSNKNWKTNLIADEAHTLLPHLRTYFSKEKWQHKVGYPIELRSYDDLVRWFKKNGFSEMMSEMGFDSNPAYLIEPRWRPYGKKRERRHQLNFLPLKVDDRPPVLWPPTRVKKLILMSATISRKDVEYLGLDKRRVTYVESGSPIDAARRPIIFESIGSMAYAQQDRQLPKLVTKLRELADRHDGESGLVHATYSLAAKLRTTELGEDRRFIFHTRQDKAMKYAEFRRQEGRILVGSGMYEGLDLAGDAGRWQAVAKVPYPSLGDPVISYLTEVDPEYYAWETIKQLVQAFGRICRGPTDWGVTYVLDSGFKKLYDGNEDLFPNYVRESVRW